METLSLLGIHTDGEHLVLVNSAGERFLLPIEEELRSIVRQHRRKVAAALEVKNPGSIRPKEIQSMIRAGATAEEVAGAAGVDVEHVKRYEDPVISERLWVAQQARSTRVSASSDSPELGDLVIDRLATRGVSPTTLHWDATRQPGEEWTVHLEFIQDAKNYEANWEFDMDNRILTALDEQSRWLTETATPSGSDTLLRRSIFAQANSADPNEASAKNSGMTGTSSHNPTKSPAQSPNLSKTEALVDELNAARGTRLTVVAIEEEDDVSAMEAAIASGFREDSPTEAKKNLNSTGKAPVTPLKSLQPLQTTSPASPQSSRKNPPHPTANAPKEPNKNTTIAKKTKVGTLKDTNDATNPLTPDNDPLPGMEQIPPRDTNKAISPKRTRPGRAQMPSWDEILFGTKSD